MIVRVIAARRLAQVTKRTHTTVDDLVVDLLRRTRFPFLLLLALAAASLALALPAGTTAAIRTLTVLGFLIQGAVWGSGLVSFGVARASAKRSEDTISLTMIEALGYAARIILLAIIFLLILDNLGVNVTALVAGLGIGGVAVALAVQNVLGDLLAALSIVLDKPFVIGDVIAVDQFVGSIEHIGLRSTRLRSVSGEQIVMTNSDLIKSRIRNFKRMFERRVVFTLGVVHRSTHDQLVRIPALIREIITAQRYTRFDRSHLVGPGGSSLTCETVYFITQPGYTLYMDTQQAIYLEIFRRFGEEQIELA
jgi:small-conductance mechanosensitive channel